MNKIRPKDFMYICAALERVFMTCFVVGHSSHICFCYCTLPCFLKYIYADVCLQNVIQYYRGK